MFDIRVQCFTVLWFFFSSEVVFDILVLRSILIWIGFLKIQGPYVWTAGISLNCIYLLSTDKAGKKIGMYEARLGPSGRPKRS